MGISRKSVRACQQCGILWSDQARKSKSVQCPFCGHGISIPVDW